MLERVHLKRKKIDDYLPLLGKTRLAHLRKLAKPLKGRRFLQLNATSYGGGVAELLNSVVPLLNDLGVSTDWAILPKNKTFFETTKKFHNGLQGKAGQLTAKGREIYLKQNQACADLLTEPYDLIMVHDPQPAAVRKLSGRRKTKWIWRCHLDTTTSDSEVWGFLQPFAEAYDASIFTLKEFIPSSFKSPLVRCIAPAIDPFTSKNVGLDPSVYQTIVSEFGIDLRRPFILQVSRFDPWKDPDGVLEVFQKARAEVPGLQLAYVGDLADDDPEGWNIYDRIRKQTRGDEDILLYINLSGVHAFEVNCFQRAASVVIQKSIREGFGLVVTEALWKEAGMVAARVGGIPLQIHDGKTGLLADGTDDFASKVIRLLQHPDERAVLGKQGRELVRSDFLIPRLLEQELELYRELLG
jgi:trehalose synthase